MDFSKIGAFLKKAAVVALIVAVPIWGFYELKE